MVFFADGSKDLFFLDLTLLQYFTVSPYFCSVSTHEIIFQKTPREEAVGQEATSQETRSETQCSLFISLCELLGVTPCICLSIPFSICPKPDYQFQFTFRSSGMKTLRAFLIMGCGFNSSSENLRLRGSNISWPGMLERARSAGSGS